MNRSSFDLFDFISVCIFLHSYALYSGSILAGSILSNTIRFGSVRETKRDGTYYGEPSRGKIICGFIPKEIIKRVPHLEEAEQPLTGWQSAEARHNRDHHQWTEVRHDLPKLFGHRSTRNGQNPNQVLVEKGAFGGAGFQGGW